MAEDFVAMSMYQTEAGEFEAILPADELQGIYKRITENEIKVGDIAKGQCGWDVDLTWPAMMLTVLL